MIELLVLIAIATIGVIYTSSTGEAESKAMAEKTAKDALNEAEGQSGIGILGIDVVARKMRAMVGLSDTAVTADELASYRGHDDEDEDAAPEPLMSRREREVEEEVGDDTTDAFVWAGEERPAPPADRKDMPVAAEADEDLSEDDWAEDDDDDFDYDDAAEDDDGYDDDDDAYDDIDAYDDLDDYEEDGVPVAADAPLRDSPRLQDSWAADAEADRVAASVTDIDTSDAPLVEDFDPSRDELLISYRPGEAGNGRIGIAEDPLRPGSAAVTLGGRCVAVVVNGYGKVRAHHIDLVCEDGEDIAA